MASHTWPQDAGSALWLTLDSVSLDVLMLIVRAIYATEKTGMLEEANLRLRDAAGAPTQADLSALSSRGCGRQRRGAGAGHARQVKMFCVAPTGLLRRGCDDPRPCGRG